MALCPAHDDSTPSLHVTVNDDGDVGVYCHGGCPKAICRAVLVLMGETSSSASRARGPPCTRATPPVRTA